MPQQKAELFIGVNSSAFLDFSTHLFYSDAKYNRKETTRMNTQEHLQQLRKDQLIQLIALYSKNLIAMDGVWFQSIEQTFGMDEAMKHDCNIWRQFSAIEAKRIRAFLQLPDHSGLHGLAMALPYRYNAMVNQDEIIQTEDALIYRVITCRVQAARERKQMDFHPCKPAGLIEYQEFARAIDDRIVCECLSCFPDVTDETCCCAWKFTLRL